MFLGVTLCLSVVTIAYVSVEVEGGIGANISDTAVFKAKVRHVLMAAGYFKILLVLYLSLKKLFLMPVKNVGNHPQLQVFFFSALL